jgi:hypothetical protein
LCVNATDRLGKRRKGSGWCELSFPIFALRT